MLFIDSSYIISRIFIKIVLLMFRSFCKLQSLIQLKQLNYLLLFQQLEISKPHTSENAFCVVECSVGIRKIGFPLSNKTTVGNSLEAIPVLIFIYSATSLHLPTSTFANPKFGCEYLFISSHS